MNNAGLPRNGKMPGDGTLAVLFADISGSTSLYESLGNQLAQKIVADCLQRLGQVARQHQGRVIKNIGDEIMCVFPDAKLAVGAAGDMHSAMKQRFGAGKGGIQLSIRIGLHIGQVVDEGNDVFGDAVNVAAQVTSFAKARQILTTEHVVQSLDSWSGKTIRLIDTTTLKGKREKVNIYEVVWDGEGLTIAVENPNIVKGTEPSLILEYRSQRIDVKSGMTGASMGRSSESDLFVDDAFTSRTHALIRYRNHKFVLCDKSTNGTYLLTGDKPVYLHMDEYPLQGSGSISLGRLLAADSPDVVRFQVDIR